MSEDEEMWGNSALSFGRVCLVPLPLYFSNLCWKTYLTPMQPLLKAYSATLYPKQGDYLETVNAWTPNPAGSDILSHPTPSQ